MKNILITTQHRGVFLARANDNADLTARSLTDLSDLRQTDRSDNTNMPAYVSVTEFSEPISAFHKK